MKKIALLLCFLFSLSVASFALPKINIDLKTPNAAPQETMAKDRTSIGGPLVIDETTTVGNAIAVGGDVTVAGKVMGDAVAVGGNLTLKSTAKIDGDIVAIGGKVVKEDGASVGGKETELLSPALAGLIQFTTQPSVSGAFQLVIPAIIWISVLALLLLVAAFFTKNVGWASYAMETAPWRSILWGLVALALVVPIAFALVITIIGIPLILAEIIVYTAAGVLGLAVASQLVGKKLFTLIRKSGRPMLWEVIIGYVVIWLVSLVPVVGGLVRWLLIFVAFGAVVRSRFGTIKN